jgi:hypothetical protein
MKKILFIFIASIMLFVTTGTMTNASSFQVNDNKVKYEAWFNEKINNADKDEKKELEETFKQYQNLSLDDQNKFVNYMFDPTVQEEIAETFLIIPEGTTTKLNEGDISITSSSHPNLGGEASYANGPEGIAPAGYQSRKAIYYRYVTFFGIKVFQTTSWVRYEHNGTNISKVIGGNHFTSINYNPSLSTSYSLSVNWSNNTTAYSSSDLTFSFVWEGFGIIYGSGELGVWGNVNNNAGGWYTPY